MDPILPGGVGDDKGMGRAGETEFRPPERLALRLEEVAAALGVGKRTLERERSAGRFPAPDLRIGKISLWTVATIRRWLDAGGAR